MDHLKSIWDILAPLLFILIFILGIVFTIRMSQKLCLKLMTVLSNEVKKLYQGNGLPQARTEQGCSPFIYYFSLFLGSFLGIIVSGLALGIVMLMAVSEFLSSINLSMFPSFFISVTEWMGLILSGILLIFGGLYGSRLFSYYLHKLPSPYAHTFAQVFSLSLLSVFVLMSLNRFGSAVQFINLSLIIVTSSLFIALIMSIMNSKNLPPYLKSFMHKII